ncbi:hypothetical protein [Denitrificimonas caeni]|uniref:Lipoprotein n=1 Tax=Denitrificimonas caeni TaxID=521720 RepID=A0AAE9VNI9_9GAMM|nr:hypothetical protein [Denitrificimonas caeni]WBE25386.1 hypothetical protein O6P33_00605 [Denitrificimonas caeni]
MSILLRSCALFMLSLSLLACHSQSPIDALDAAAQSLEENLSSKRNSAVTEQLHQDFSAQQGMDKKAAQQYMLLLFMRFKNVNILVINRTCQLDNSYRDRGHCSAQVAISGAQGLIPERADYYKVNSQWQLDDKDWQLVQLQWD